MILIWEGERLVPFGNGGEMDKDYVVIAVPRNDEADRAFISTTRQEGCRGVYLREVYAPADIERASTLLRVAELKSGLPDRSLSILAAIENPQAALTITTFGKIIPRLEALVFDGASLALATGAATASRTIEAVRLALPLAAAASSAKAYLKWDPDLWSGPHEKPAWQEAQADGYSGFVVSDRDTAGRLLAAFSAG